jgi:chromosome segregation ATPase
LNDEEARNIQVLQEKIVELSRNVRRYEDRIKELTNTVDVLKERCEKAQLEAKDEREISMGVRKEYSKAQGTISSLNYEVEKYKGLYKNAHENLAKAEERKNELEMTAKLLEDISASKSTHDWANSVKENLSPNEQSVQFYNALMVTENNLKTYENEIKELKLALQRESNARRAINRECCKMKKVMDRLKTDQIRKESEQAEANRSKRTHEEMLQSDSLIETVSPHSLIDENPPKRLKTLSLLNRTVPNTEMVSSFTSKLAKPSQSLINRDITSYIKNSYSMSK